MPRRPSGRREPYTERGIHRVPCARCGAPSHASWQICADGNIYRGLCIDCDIAMNTMVMRFVFGDTRDDDIRGYAAILRAKEKAS